MDESDQSLNHIEDMDESELSADREYMEPQLDDSSQIILCEDLFSSDSSSNDDDNDDDGVYEVETDEEQHPNLPGYSIDNKQFPVTPEDRAYGWIRENIDSGASHGPFLTSSSTIIDLTNPTPEHFFYQLFDDRMWTIIAEATNAYAQSKAETPQGILQYFIW